jgi:hypothetical protein
VAKLLSAEAVLKAVISLLPIARTQSGTPFDGTAMDAKGMGDILVVVSLGVNTATGTQDIVVQDSADNITFADIAGAVFPQKTTATDETFVVGVVRQGTFRRYVRARDTVGTAVSTAAGVILIGLAPQDSALPVSGALTPVFTV